MKDTHNAMGVEKRDLSDYRFSYQGSEKESELYASVYSTEYRFLDSRLGKWFSADPIEQPHQSPYCSMDNNPVALNDVLGLSTGGDEDKKKGKEGQRCPGPSPESPDGKCHHGKRDAHTMHDKHFWQTAGNFARAAGTVATTLHKVRGPSLSKSSQTLYQNKTDQHIKRNPTEAKRFFSEILKKNGQDQDDIFEGFVFRGNIAFQLGYGPYKDLYTVFTGKTPMAGKEASRGWAAFRFGLAVIPAAKGFSVIGKAGSASRGAWMSGSTILGDDAATAINASRMVPEEGIHQVLLHGTPTGFVMNGAVVTPKHVARVLLGNGFQRGTTIRLISCNTGVFGDGAAYQLSRYLRSPVIAPTNKVRILEDGTYEIFGGGTFKTFFNTTIIK